MYNCSLISTAIFLNRNIDRDGADIEHVGYDAHQELQKSFFWQPAISDSIFSLDIIVPEYK